jgi:hypothetical protein
MGIVAGVKFGLIITLGLAIIAVLIVLAVNIPVKIGEATNIRGVWRTFHFELKRLPISDIIIRTCEGMAEVFIVL